MLAEYMATAMSEYIEYAENPDAWKNMQQINFLPWLLENFKESDTESAVEFMEET